MKFFDTTSQTNHECPKCGYQWDGACRGALSTDQMTLDDVLAIDESANGLIEPVVCESEPVEQVEAIETSSDGAKPVKRHTSARDYSPMLDVEERATQESLALGIEKPPYRIPPLAEILATPKNGLNVVSTFSGCGGSSLGFHWAGFTSLWASEFVPAAADTYRANFPNTPLGVQDIRDVEPELLLAYLGIRRGDLDVLEGSPPCASFSMAGKRDAHWGAIKKYSDVEQRTDDLLMEFARLVWGLWPRAFVMENVPGLLGGVAKGYWLEVGRAFESAGYRVMGRVLDAQHLGVPQRRKRAIIVGFRFDVEAGSRFEWFPESLSYTYSIRDALPNLVGRLVVDQKSSTFNDEEYVTPSMDDPIATVTKTGVGADDMYDWRLVATEEELIETSIERYAIGEEWAKLAPGESSDKYLNLVRPDEDAPSPTVTQTGGNVGAASVTHPNEPRKFTLAELRRLCAFPDDFELTGSFRQGWERLGRAVPPPMMRAVASKIADVLLETS